MLSDIKRNCVTDRNIKPNNVNITYFENQEKYFNVRYNTDNSIEIKAKYNESLLDTQFKLSLLDENKNVISELYIKVVNLYG